MSEERALRDALERAQARTKTLERLLAEESEDREALADELLALRQALDDAEQKLLPVPGEARALVRLNAQVHAQQLQLSNLVLERDKLAEKLAYLSQKPTERARLEQRAELIRLRERVAELERQHE